MNKRKEIESFLGENLDKIEIDNENIREIEKKYKVAKSFVIKEIIIQSIITVVVFYHLRFATSDFPIIVYGELGNTIYYVLSVLIRAITVVWILRAALNIYALMKYKSKIKKYYQN